MIFLPSYSDTTCWACQNNKLSVILSIITAPPHAGRCHPNKTMAMEKNSLPDLKKLIQVLNRNIAAFQRNNVARFQALHSYGSSGFRKVFLLVPVFIQVNHPSIPGYLEEEGSPRGIYGFRDSKFQQISQEMWPGPRNEWDKAITSLRPVVESLILMGSSGSVGHTSASDLDYWVCVDTMKIRAETLDLLRKKLDLISEWAARTHSTEVNFYLINTEDVAANRLRPQGEEAEGEVAPLLLKEELYRTILLVAGRAPLWWALPAGTSFRQYNMILDNMSEFEPHGFYSADYIDLGFPLRPDPQEFMAAALWLSQKSEADPFKGVLKMIILLEQVESKLQAPLLCDLVKAAVLTAGDAELPVDPYAITIGRVLDFSLRKLTEPELELVRISAYYKVRGPLDREKEAEDTPKERLLRELVEKWGWDSRKTDDYNSYSSWPDRRKLGLGQDVKNLLFTVYKRVAQKLIEDYPDQVTTEDQSLNQLTAKILSRYSGHQAKVEDLPSSIHRKTLPHFMTLVYYRSRWGLYGGRLEAWQAGTEEFDGRLIYECSRAARAAAWLVHNRLVNSNLKLTLRPRPGPVGLETIIELLKKLVELFPTLPHGSLSEKSHWTTGGKGPRLLVLNLEEPWHETKMKSVDLIYRTAWGEMRHSALKLDSPVSEAEKAIATAEKLLETGEMRIEDVHYFAPPEAAGKRMRNNLQAAVVQTLGGLRRRREGPGAERKMRLDTD